MRRVVPVDRILKAMILMRQHASGTKLVYVKGLALRR